MELERKTLQVVFIFLRSIFFRRRPPEFSRAFLGLYMIGRERKNQSEMRFHFCFFARSLPTHGQKQLSPEVRVTKTEIEILI